MHDAENRIISIGNQPVFLVLSEQKGSDFTFYLRNDDSTKLVRQVLRSGYVAPSAQSGASSASTQIDASGASIQTEDESSEPKLSYSCRVNILTQLGGKDLKADENNRKQMVLLQRLLAAGDPATAQSHYTLLRTKLPKICASLSLVTLEDKELVKQLIKELNELLKTDNLEELFTDSSLSGDDRNLLEQIEQITDAETKKKLSNQIKFCARFADEIKPLKERIRVGRVLAGLSYEGKVWCFSFREQEKEAGYEPDKESVSDLSNQTADGNMNSIEEICHSLYEEIFYAVSRSEDTEDLSQRGRIEDYRSRIDRHRKESLPEMSGLIVISGSTNSAKSLITRGLIHLYLENILNSGNQKRRPHLVTFEDPIEKYFAADTYAPSGLHSQLDVSMMALEKKIDYTPRQHVADVKTLKASLKDALRQTPKVFFVGETREKNDWRELIDFAGTGHLIVTTAHAGSLIEAMHKIFLATEAKTPADRREVASRLLAVVQLKRTEINTYKYGALVPTLWRRVPKGLNALTSEGLASVLPHSHSDAAQPCSCLGRKYFAENLMQLAKDRQLPEAIMSALITKAIEWDLQGA